jgi:hypothetical protein
MKWLRNILVSLVALAAFAVLLNVWLFDMTEGNREAAMSACKVKAMETFKDDAKNRGDYVYDCMLAAGYRHEDHLSSCTADLIDKSSLVDVCFYRPNWLNRLIRLFDK